MKSKSFLIGKQLKKYRENSKFTQQQVADALGVDRSTYTYYELNHTSPGIPGIIKLARIFNVPITVLVGDYIEPSTDLEAYTSLEDSGLVNKPVENYEENILTLSPDERSILASYRSLKNEQKLELITFANKLNKEYSRD